MPETKELRSAWPQQLTSTMATLQPLCNFLRPRLYQNHCPAWNPRHRQVFLSLYGGVGRVAENWRDRGGESLLVDMADDECNDLDGSGAAADVRAFLRARDAEGRTYVAALGLDIPCDTWSAARGRGRGPPMLRSKASVLGLPNLKGKNLNKVLAANSQVELAVSWIRECCSLGISGYLENGAGSLIWHHPGIVQLIGEGLAWETLLCQCQYGRPYQKRTRLLLWGLPKGSVTFRNCRLKGGLCSQTGQKHEVLSGCHEDGSFKTKAAQQYSVELAAAIADALWGS